MSEEVLKPPYYLSYDPKADRLHYLDTLRATPRTSHSSSSQLVRENLVNSSPILNSSSCIFDEDCEHLKTDCDLSIRQCFCPKNYFNRRNLLEHKQLAKFETSSNSDNVQCLRGSQLGDVCTFEEQCFVANSTCPLKHFKGPNACRCKSGFRTFGNSHNRRSKNF